MEPLFFTPDVQFEKVSSEVMLPEDPNQWPVELLQELYKQVPYVADFEPHVTMDRVEGERGYGFGHIEVQNKTVLPAGGSPQERAAGGVQVARIPVVIKDRRLQPLDLLLTPDSRTVPLTEKRLRQVVFRPQIFDQTGRGPGDQSMVGQLYPPFRQNGQDGRGYTTDGSFGKFGAAAPSLLEAILPTINESDYQRFFSVFEKDAGLAAAYVHNGLATSGALRTLARWEPAQASSHKLAQALYGAVKPSVVQLRKQDEGYLLKAASHRFWNPTWTELDRGEALALLGEKVVLAADLHGGVTMALGDDAEEPAEDPTVDLPALISEPGMYRVQDEKGRHLTGLVLPNLLDFDGTSLPLSLFTNGSQQAVQGDIAGVRVGDVANLPEGRPQGYGVFYVTQPNGKVRATVPITLHATARGPEAAEGVTLVGESFSGAPYHVLVQANLRDLTPVAPGQVLVPDSWSWMPLGQAEGTSLVGDPTRMHKTAHPTRALAAVVLRSSGGDSYSVEGPAVEKLGHDERQFLSQDDALFLLKALGVSDAQAAEKLGYAAAFSAPVTVRVGRMLCTSGQAVHEAKLAARQVLAGVPRLAQDLVKEAAVIPDPMAVDTVLSLGFLNPENLGLFIQYLPLLQSTQEKLCDLLLAARLGLREVSPAALERAVKSTEEVLEGLQVLAFSGTDRAEAN